MMRMKQNMLKNKIENNFKKEVDKMKNEIINEMNLKSDFENGDKMTNNLTNEMEERKMTRLGLYDQEHLQAAKLNSIVFEGGCNFLATAFLI